MTVLFFDLLVECCDGFGVRNVGRDGQGFNVGVRCSD